MRLQICPFCDQPLTPRNLDWFKGLPITTSSTLPDLMAQAWLQSEPRERSSNRNARRCKSEFSELQKKVCNQHRYETMSLPLYIQYRWPTTVNFSELLSRLTRKSVLDRLAYIYDQPELGLMISGSPLPSRKMTRRGIQHTGDLRRYSALEKRFNKKKDRMNKAG